jgi:hypothetical protein
MPRLFFLQLVCGEGRVVKAAKLRREDFHLPSVLF